MHETDWALVAIGGGGASFLLCFLLQILVWRWLRVRKQMLWLALIYFALPLLVAAAVAGKYWFPLMLFQAALGSGYVMTFPAIQAQSPSLELVLWIWRRGGCRPAELTLFSGEGALLDQRRHDLAHDGLLKPGGDLSLGGRLLGGFFLWYRKTLRVPEERG